MVSHISGARFVGYKEFSLNTVKDIAKNRQLIVYCAVGKRSDDIGKKLMLAGYTNIQNIYGGIFEWVNNGYPVVDEQGRQTEKIHIYSPFYSWWVERGKKVH